MSNEPGLVPELTVTDYEASRRFWCDLVGFSLRYERPEEGFGYLVLGNAHLMLDQIDQGRTWATGPLEFPLVGVSTSRFRSTIWTVRCSASQMQDGRSSSNLKRSGTGRAM